MGERIGEGRLASSDKLCFKELHQRLNGNRASSKARKGNEDSFAKQEIVDCSSRDRPLGVDTVLFITTLSYLNPKVDLVNLPEFIIYIYDQNIAAA